MVRNNEAATEARTIEGPEDVEVGDTIDVSGKSFLPKSNLEVVEVDPEWADDERYDDARVFTARIPNRSNARDYTFKVSAYGTVVTTNSRGVFDNYRLTAKKIVDVDEDDTDEDDDVIAAAEDAHGHKHEAEEVGDDAIVIRETFNDGSTSRLYLRPDGPLDLTYEVVRTGDDDSVGIREVFPDGSSSYTSVPTEVYDAIADDVAHFVDDPEDEDVATDGGAEEDDDPTCEACDRDDLSALPDDDGRGAYRCEWCGAFVDEDGRLPRADDKLCPKCDGPVAYGVLKDARKGIRGYLCVDGCDDRRIVRPEDKPPVATDGGTDYADAKGDALDVVREALRDADADTLRDTFADVVDHARDEGDTVRVDTYVSPAFVARKGIADGFGRFRYDGPLGAIPGDGAERVTFHVSPEDDASSVRNRVLQALTPFDPPVGGTNVP